MGCTYLDDAEKLLKQIIKEGGGDFKIYRTPQIPESGIIHEAITVHKSESYVEQGQETALLTTWQYHVGEGFIACIQAPGLYMQVACGGNNNPLRNLECIFQNYCCA